MTSVLLQTGMWASFNVPWFENIYNLTGYPHDAKLIINAPRAKIFARDGPQVSSVSALKRLLRYNKCVRGLGGREWRQTHTLVARAPARGKHGIPLGCAPARRPRVQVPDRPAV